MDVMEEVKLAAFCCKLKAMREDEEKAKKARSIKVIPMKTAEDRHTALTCQATNMNGKPCKSRAVCGKYCRRHKI